MHSQRARLGCTLTRLPTQPTGKETRSLTSNNYYLFFWQNKDKIVWYNSTLELTNHNSEHWRAEECLDTQIHTFCFLSLCHWSWLRIESCWMGTVVKQFFLAQLTPPPPCHSCLFSTALMRCLIDNSSSLSLLIQFFSSHHHPTPVLLTQLHWPPVTLS